MASGHSDNVKALEPMFYFFFTSLQALWHKKSMPAWLVLSAEPALTNGRGSVLQADSIRAATVRERNAAKSNSPGSELLFGLLLATSFGIAACGEAPAEEAALGPFYQQFKLTLAPGNRTEMMGPLFYDEHKESTHLWAVPPLFSRALDPDIDYEESDYVYPIISYDRFGSEYRFHIFH